jgi:hypothetical protein
MKELTDIGKLAVLEDLEVELGRELDELVYEVLVKV